MEERDLTIVLNSDGTASAEKGGEPFKKRTMRDEHAVSRRSALKYLGILAASAAGREFLATWLPQPVYADGHKGLVTMPGMKHEHTESPPSTSYAPQFFTPEEFRTVEILTEMIIPTDETPGAKEAQVANYIDFVVFSAAEFKPSLQREWIEGLAVLDHESRGQFGKAFPEGSEADRTKLLTLMSVTERDPSARDRGFEFFKLLKDMTVEGFYTSKIGLIDVLDYQGMNYMSDFPGCTHPEHQQ
jgi:gluconate 2-dehydrogenase gamma chain